MGIAGAELARFRARLNQLLAVRPGARGPKPQEAQGAEAQSAEAKPDAKGKEARKQG
jgi:hypothetical protein